MRPQATQQTVSGGGREWRRPPPRRPGRDGAEDRRPGRDGAEDQAAPIMRDSGYPTKLTEPRLGCSPPGRRQERREASGGTRRRDWSCLIRSSAVGWRARPKASPDEQEKHDDIRLCEMLLWAAVQGPRRGQQSPLSGRGAETLRRVRDGGQWRLPDPQGASEVLTPGGARQGPLPGRLAPRQISVRRRRQLPGNVTSRHRDDLLDAPAVAVEMQFQMACGVDKTRHRR